MLNRTKALIVAAAAAAILPQWASAEEGAPGGCEPLAEISGATLFAENCTLCHGPDGKGGGPLAAAKNLTPPDLTTLAARTHGKFPMDHVSDELRHGGGGKTDGDKTMPVWKKIFAHECGDAYARQAEIELEKFLRVIQEK
jgi:putative copper resistance protein D